MALLEETADGLFLVYCPGCKISHWINVNKPNRPRWTWNGDREKPTFSPSILVRYPWGDPPVDQRCHSFIRDGQWQFLQDCTHELAGKTVPMVEDPE